MGKRKETIILENALIKRTREKRIYGCEEITIGFHNGGKGNEIVDFMTMDSKGIIKCYEIKVTLEDLKSKAKKSWYGNYNYLVVSEELYNKVEDWSLYVPKTVGILVGEQLVNKRNCKMQSLDKDTQIMLKESMIRSMFYKMCKYKDAQSVKKQRELQSEIRELKKEKKMWYDRALKNSLIISNFETYKCLNEDLDFFDLEKEGNKLKEEYRSKNRKKD